MNTLFELRKQLETAPIECPECEEISNSIKSYKLPNFTFAFIAYKWGFDHHIACANCMRKKILEVGVKGLIKGNILWPIFYFPWISVNLTRTFVRGHSEDIIDGLQNQILQ